MDIGYFWNFREAFNCSGRWQWFWFVSSESYRLTSQLNAWAALIYESSDVIKVGKALKRWYRWLASDDQNFSVRSFRLNWNGIGGRVRADLRMKFERKKSQRRKGIHFFLALFRFLFLSLSSTDNPSFPSSLNWPLKKCINSKFADPFDKKIKLVRSNHFTHFLCKKKYYLGDALSREIIFFRIFYVIVHMYPREFHRNVETRNTIGGCTQNGYDAA